MNRGTSVADAVRVDVVRAGQLATVAGFGEPGFDHFGGDLDVELQAPGTLADAKGLVAAGGALRQMRCAGRNVECVAVPLEDNRIGRAVANNGSSAAAAVSSSGYQPISLTALA